MMRVHRFSAFVAVFLLASSLSVSAHRPSVDLSSSAKSLHPSSVVATDESLPSFAAIGKVYLAGVSSGGYMANQLHLAYSTLFSGAAIFAAGPWGCAGGLVERALYACTDDTLPLDLSALELGTTTAGASGLLDLSGVAGSPVWLFHGMSDGTVKAPVANAAATLYSQLGADLIYVNTSLANHSWVSPLGAQACTVSESPYTAQCGDYDPQADFLSHLLRRPVSPRNSGAATGSLRTFSQDSYTFDRWALPAADLSMDDTGYVYVPEQCSSGAVTCDVFLVLHGCEQCVSLVGRDLIDEANLNEYADTNSLIIVYPQTIPLVAGVVLNPEACWDWWGYLADDDLYASRGGYQIEVLVDMIKSLQA